MISSLGLKNTPKKHEMTKSGVLLEIFINSWNFVEKILEGLTMVMDSCLFNIS